MFNKTNNPNETRAVNQPSKEKPAPNKNADDKARKDKLAKSAMLSEGGKI